MSAVRSMIVGLFPDLLPNGGVQMAGRQTSAVLIRIARERDLPSRILSLNDPKGMHEAQVGSIRFQFKGFGRSKFAFILEALRTADKGLRLVVVGHPNLAVPAMAMRSRNRRFCLLVLSHGIEVWNPLSRLRHASLLRAECVLAPSHYTAQKLKQIQGLPEHNIRVLPWGLDPAFLELTESAARVPLPGSIPKTRYILGVGRWSSVERYKGFDTLIQAMPGLLKVVEDLSLVLVGDGDDRPFLEKLASELGVAGHVYFVSGLCRQGLISAYAHADVFALPSNGEGFGLVFLEAMALGKPVVGGNHGGIPDIIEDGVTGFLVPHGDVTQLAERVALLLTHPSLAADIARRGRERVLQHFRFENFEAGLRDVLAEVCPGMRTH
jgi:glycosyltransferase involved in cell wall biosynthesis